MAEKILKATSVREDCLNSLVNFEKDKKYSNIELSGAVDRYNSNNNDLDKLYRYGYVFLFNQPGVVFNKKSY